MAKINIEVKDLERKKAILKSRVVSHSILPVIHVMESRSQITNCHMRWNVIKSDCG